MKYYFLPKTRKGKWSVCLFSAFLVFALAGGLISSITGNTIEYPNPFNSPLLGTVIYLMFLASMLASLFGVISMWKDGERSVLVCISIPIGIVFLIFILVFAIANLIGPPK